MILVNCLYMFPATGVLYILIGRCMARQTDYDALYSELVKLWTSTEFLCYIQMTCNTVVYSSSHHLILFMPFFGFILPVRFAIYVFICRERLPRSAITKVSETDKKISGRWNQEEQWLPDTDGQEWTVIVVPGSSRETGLIMFYFLISSVALDSKIGHIFQFMSYLIIIVLLSRFCCPWDFSRVIQLQSEFGKLHLLLQNHMSVISCSASLLWTLGFLCYHSALSPKPMSNLHID